MHTEWIHLLYQVTSYPIETTEWIIVQKSVSLEVSAYVNWEGGVCPRTTFFQGIYALWQNPCQMVDVIRYIKVKSTA